MLMIENDENVAVGVDGFDDALIGYGTQFNSDVAIYDYEKCVMILVKRDGMTYEEAKEYMEYNVCGAWMGKNTPVFLRETVDETFDD
jgi:hypothetical protein